MKPGRQLRQIIGGLVILTGLYSTNATLRVSAEQNRVASQQAELAKRQFALAESGQVTERFTRATDQIGSPNIALRLGAILAFDRLSRDSTPSDAWAVITLLAVWVRTESPWPPRRSRKRSKAPADIQAALSVVAERNTAQDNKNEILDLSDSDLRGVYLVNGSLGNIDFSNAHLEDADLSGTVFDESELSGAHLTGTHLEAADLSKTDVTESQLQSALGNTDTKLPAGVARPANWPAH
jgi:Pentapeptide repeats (8 copies)